MTASKTLVLLLTVGCLIAPVHAEEFWQNQLARLEAQIALVRKQMELRGELERANSGYAQALPEVVSTAQVAGRRSARLKFKNGRVSTVGEGESIAPSVRVASISSNGVHVLVGAGKRKARTVALEFASASTVAGTVTQASPGNGANGAVGGLGFPAELLMPPPDVSMPVAQKKTQAAAPAVPQNTPITQR